MQNGLTKECVLMNSRGWRVIDCRVWLATNCSAEIGKAHAVFVRLVVVLARKVRVQVVARVEALIAQITLPEIAAHRFCSSHVSPIHVPLNVERAVARQHHPCLLHERQHALYDTQLDGQCPKDTE